MMSKMAHPYFSTNLLVSKANTLKFLQNKTRFSKIEGIFDFTVAKWKKNQDEIIKEIGKIFHNSKIIVRSSARGEDSIRRSMAGNYVSIQHVDPTSPDSVRNAVNLVIDSYIQKGNQNQKNQILVQTQTEEIRTSGVIFTRDPDFGAPYYVINFEDDVSTDHITKGLKANTVKLFRKINDKEIPKKWKNLLSAVREIEKIFSLDTLDIEFGIKANSEIIIFQVRPITSIKKQFIVNTDREITNIISNNIKKFKKLQNLKKYQKIKPIFSDMSDWNPAEIIGNNPNFLDYSVYDYMIMNGTWAKGRIVIGYQKPHDERLMMKFGNKPYVDVRKSFHSLIPDRFSKKLTYKLMRFYISKLEKNPHLHDKIEFEILLTCYDLNTDEKLEELRESGFTSKEIMQIKNELLSFTNKIISEFPTFASKCTNYLQQLAEKREIVLNKANLKKNHYTQIDCIEKLLNDGRELTVQFATMARIAFVSSTILKSLKNNNIIADAEIEGFMNTIQSPLSEIQNDLELYVNKKMSKIDFLRKYGHLRPGTYDITALRYDKNRKFFENIKHLNKLNKKTKLPDNAKIDEILFKNGLHFESTDFFTFIRESLVQRERLKFEFTKNLSAALELIACVGKRLGFTRENIANLTLEDILNSKNMDEKKVIILWRKKISINSRRKNISSHLLLPPIIFSEKDFKIISHYVAKPNYITSDTITADLFHLDTNKISDLSNYIIMIENADPGYDWIFTKNPSGLITKYGGVASHMAIRCAELGLPAAIGCGEIIFERLYHAKKIMLDCKNQQIIVLQHEGKDEYIEEKKILKSLGYIK